MKGIAFFTAVAGGLSLAFAASAQSYSRTEQLAYEDNLVSWVLGQEKSSTNPAGAIVEWQIDYSASSLPIRHYEFGKLTKTVTYNTDGTPATVTDGNNNLVTLSNWKRGIPQRRS